jgi:hypothetical protein
MSGGKGGGSSPPPAPDPSAVAHAQAAANVNTAIAQSYLNNVNQVTPTGNLTYEKIGTTTVDGKEVPQWRATTALSPEQQRIFNTVQSVTQGTADLARDYAGRIADATRTPFSYEGMPAAPQYNQAYIDQVRNQILARNQPQQDRDLAMLEQKLASQGIGRTNEAYTAAMDQYNRGVNDFRLGADVQAGNMAAQRFGLEDTSRKNAITEAQALRTQPISEVATLLGTGQGVQYPQFTPTHNYQVAPTDVAGIYGNNYAAQMAAWNAQNQAAQRANSGLLSGLFGLGSSFLGGGMAGGWKF